MPDPGLTRFRRPALATAAVLLGMVVLLRFEGRRWWCACESPAPWSSDARGPHNSQHPADPYTLTHVLHGFALYGLLAVVVPRWAVGWRLAVAAAVEAGWEVVENSPMAIERYRAATAAVGYSGDAVINSVGDLLACVAGFGLAGRLGWRWTLAAFVAVELLLLIWIRDNLTLNVVMLAYPTDGLKAWQSGG